jgi:hypothetical protein
VRATWHEIAERYAEWEITGPAEIRTTGHASFNPNRTVTHALRIKASAAPSSERAQFEQPVPRQALTRGLPPGLDYSPNSR